VTSPDQLAAPVLQLSDLATADLQVVLDGIELPWPVLGGSQLVGTVRPRAEPIGAETHRDEAGLVQIRALEAGSVGVQVPRELADQALAAGRLVLADREQTPIGELVDLGPGPRADESTQVPGQGNEAEAHDDVDEPHGAATTVLSGRVQPLRARESRLFLDHAAEPAKLGAAEGARHAIVVGRPLLTEDVDLISAFSGQLLLLVPVESTTPDGVPPVTLMRSVLHVASGLGPRARVVATPLHWRDPASDEALVQAIGSAYAADRTDLIFGGPAWADLLDALRSGGELPAVADEAVLQELRRWRRPPAERGAMILFTGLSGSGKSTLARDLAAHVVERTVRTVSLLDGDDVRRLLSAGLGFDHAARDLNVRRIGYVGSEVARHGGLAICAPIAPYAESRAAVRAMVEPVGDFVLVHVSTSLEECERRDLKGLYAKARAGLIPEFTGISDPYDEPVDADLVVDTAQVSREQALNRVLDLLHSRGLVVEDSTDETGKP
jgi:sulfate adenylyltransferase